MRLDIAELTRAHDEAMNLAAEADLAKMRGQLQQAAKQYREAYEKELIVAQQLVPTTIEPSRSILHRSAAVLALECGEYRAAEKLIATALVGDPPQAIASELRGLLLQIIPHLEKAAGD